MKLHEGGKQNRARLDYWGSPTLLLRLLKEKSDWCSLKGSEKADSSWRVKEQEGGRGG